MRSLSTNSILAYISLKFQSGREGRTYVEQEHTIKHSSIVVDTLVELMAVKQFLVLSRL